MCGTWYPRQESNLYLEFRKPSFYPLNYGDDLKHDLAWRMLQSEPLRNHPAAALLVDTRLGITRLSSCQRFCDERGKE